MKHSGIRKETSQMKVRELLPHMGLILKVFSNTVPSSPVDNVRRALCGCFLKNDNACGKGACDVNMSKFVSPVFRPPWISKAGPGVI